MQQPATIQELYDLYLKADQQVCTDTRKLTAGSLFFALKGDNFNANEFAEKAISGGCSFAVVDEEQYCTSPKIVWVDNTLHALQQLATFHRSHFTIPVLAITGSNGKTTNKELANAVLSQKFKTLATAGNLNNHIGVPLTLLKLRKEHEFAIVEMGANHQGEIDALCRIANPDFGLITNIGKAHLDGFGGFEGVKKGKSELYRFLKSRSSKVFINGDDELLYNLAFDNDKITYGCKKLFDVIGKDYTRDDSVSFKYTTRYGEKDWTKLKTIDTKILGNYNFINCLAAVCIGNYFKVDEHLIANALETYTPNMNRSQLVNTGKNTIILDAYNANPNSMRAAIENFSKYQGTHKMLLLGDMFELGEYSAAEHQGVIALLLENNFENVVLVGDEFFKLPHAGFTRFRTTGECRQYLEEANLSGRTILIKGSRAMKMETLQEVL